MTRRIIETLVFVAVIFVALYATSPRAATCPPGYDCDAMLKYKQEAQRHLAGYVETGIGKIWLTDSPCYDGGFQFTSGARTQTGPLVSGCWFFDEKHPGTLHWFALSYDGGSWNMCAVTFVGRFSHINQQLAKACK